jgi:hypothetical protein
MPTSNQPYGNYIQNICLENSTKNSICMFGQILSQKLLENNVSATLNSTMAINLFDLEFCSFYINPFGWEADS